jgi:hypothetical protein
MTLRKRFTLGVLAAAVAALGPPSPTRRAAASSRSA